MIPRRRLLYGMAGRCPSRVHRTAALRRLALYGRPRLCHSRGRDGGISSRAAPFPMNGKGRGDILDGIIDKLVRQIFERMKAIPKSDIVNIRYREKMEERKSLLHSVRAEYAKAAADLETLKGEVIKTIRGENTFSKELLSSLIAEAEAKCQELQENMETAQAAYDEGKTVLASLNAQYDDIISWAEMYDTASMEAKKMIVNCLIKRVDVYRDYKLHIDFNIDFEQFCGGLDIVTIAA